MLLKAIIHSFQTHLRTLTSTEKWEISNEIIPFPFKYQKSEMKCKSERIITVKHAIESYNSQLLDASKTINIDREMEDIE